MHIILIWQSMSNPISVMILEHSCCVFTVHKSVIIITISIIQKRDAKIVVTPIFNIPVYDLGDIKKTHKWSYTCTGFFFKTTLKFEDSMILVTVSETWMWIKRWNLWRRCDAIQVRRCNFIQRWNLGDFTIVGTSSVRDSICKSYMKNLLFFPMKSLYCWF